MQIEEAEDFIEMIQQEKEECFNEDKIIQEMLIKRITMDMPEEELINKEPVDTVDVDIVGFCGTLIDMQEVLEDARYTAAAYHLATAWHELLRASRKLHSKSIKVGRQTLMDAFLLPA